MYAYRKPFKAATYEGLEWAGTGMSLKSALVMAQLLGYCISKFIGIKVCSETVKNQRAVSLILLMVIAELTLILHAVLPEDWKVLAMFLNGLPLGIVWGLTVSYLEGRKVSDLLLAGVCCSFIVSSGVVKDVGLAVLDMGVDTYWMPAAVGGMFLPPYILSVWLLNQIPPPSASDRKARVERSKMTSAERWAFIRSFLPGLILLYSIYFCLTAFRDYRDTYQLEIFEGLGYDATPGVFSQSEIAVGFGVLVVIAGLVLIQNNFKGLTLAFVIMVVGSLLTGLACVLLDVVSLDALAYMIITGFGSYLAYVPYNSVLFERIIAFTGIEGTTVAFPMQLADSIGYVGVFGIYLFKEFGPEYSFQELYQYAGYAIAALGAVSFVAAGYYFLSVVPSAAKRSQTESNLLRHVTVSSEDGSPLSSCDQLDELGTVGATKMLAESRDEQLKKLEEPK
eukprot:Nk52_evm1s1696 gene=Nk52_evmTU1s1696